MLPAYRFVRQLLIACNTLNKAGIAQTVPIINFHEQAMPACELAYCPLPICLLAFCSFIIFAAMHIAVDARNINTTDKYEALFTIALLQKLVQSRPKHHFTIITTQLHLLPLLPNTKEWVVENKIDHYLGLRSWYRKMLPAILKKISADALLSINGTVTDASIRQVVFISSPGAAERSFVKSFFFSLIKKYLNSRVVQADAIATFTSLQQTIIAKKRSVKAGQIIPVGYTVPGMYAPASWQQKETILLEQTNGSEYFLYTGSFAPETFLLLLKAFSLFKKRQLSSMQLIAAGSFTPGKHLTEKLATYKYRSDVQLHENADLQTLATLTKGAYVIIFLDEKSLTAFPAAAALQCHVPVISFEDAVVVKELAGTAALYASATAESLAEQMKLLYKDENLRMQLITNSMERLPLLNGDVAVEKLWDCLATTGA